MDDHADALGARVMCPLAKLPGWPTEAPTRTPGPLPSTLGPLPVTLLVAMALLAVADDSDEDDPGASPPDMRPA